MHVASKEQLADALTKKGPSTDILLAAIEERKLPQNSEDLQIEWNDDNNSRFETENELNFDIKI